MMKLMQPGQRMNLGKQILLAVATALMAFASLGAWALASPVGASPDEDYHLASIWCSWGDREGLCSAGDNDGERTVPDRLLSSSECFAHDPEQSAQCPINDTKLISTDRGNFAGEYPPVFYATMGVFAGEDIAVSTILMRLANAAVFVGAFTAVALLLRPGQRGPIIWGGLVTLVPLGVFVVPSVNPSSWAILAGLLVWISGYGYLTAESRPRRIALGAIASVLAVMGAGARGDSAVYVAFAGLIAIILTFQKERAWLIKAILPLVIICVGAAFFLASGQSVAAASEAASSAGGGGGGGGGSSAEVVVPLSSRVGMLLGNFMDLPWLWTGGAGTWGLGWYDTPVLRSVWVLMIGVIFALILWGLRVTSKRKGLLLTLALLALVFMPLYILFGKNLRVGEWVQPRYLLPLFIIFVCVALYGFARDHLGLTRMQAGIIFALITFANALAMRNNMRRYITGIDEGGFNLNANIEWWWNIPFSPMLVWMIGSAAFGLMLVGLWLWLYPKGERPGVPKEERSSELVT